MKTFLAVLIGVVVLMATFSMFGARITVTGDEHGCRDYLGEANRALYQLRMLNKTGDYTLKPRKFSDGTTIESFASGGFDYVKIHKPLPLGGERTLESTRPTLVMVGLHGTTTGFTADTLIVDRREGTIVKAVETTPGTNIYDYWFKADAYEDEYAVVGRRYDDITGKELWLVELRKGNTVKWRREYDNGYATSVVMDRTHVYACGTDFGTGIFGYQVRVEKIKKSDGSLEDTYLERYADLGTNGSDIAYACAVDAKNVYVSCSAKKTSVPQFVQARVLTLKKKTLAVLSTFYDTKFTAPLPTYEDTGMIDVATLDKEKTGPENVYMLSTRWLKKLDGTTLATHQYGYNVYDQTTKDISVFVDKSGIYTAAPKQKTGNGLCYGYEVIKRDFDNNVIWTTVYDDGIKPAVAFNSEGPAANDIDADSRNLFIAGYKRLSTSSYVFSLRQAIDKKTGDIVWTHLGTHDRGEYLWGLAIPVKHTEVTIKE